MNELKSEPDAEGLAFELNDLLVGAYWARLAGFLTPLELGLAECVIELEGPRGKMRIQWKGTTALDLAGLSRSLWESA